MSYGAHEGCQIALYRQPYMINMWILLVTMTIASVYTCVMEESGVHRIARDFAESAQQEFGVSLSASAGGILMPWVPAMFFCPVRICTTLEKRRAIARERIRPRIQSKE